MHAVFLDYDRASSADLDLTSLRRAVPELRLYEGSNAAEVALRLRDAEIVLVDQTAIPREALSAARRLRLICVAGTGYDQIDVTAAREFGIAVTHVRGYCTASVVQQTWSLILSLTQRLFAYREYATDGSWAKFGAANVRALPLRELAGRTLGIVGWGDLGSGVAKIGEAFDMRILVANRVGGAPAAERVSLGDLLASADVLSLHCPLTPDTRLLIGTRELALMKPDAVLINTARGGLVDSAALAAALRAGRLGGAGIDVLPQEPPVDGDPLLDPSIPNLIVTPHVAWAARESRQRSFDEMAANITDFLAGGRRGRVI
jgi:glycerate dehydrogenase